MIVPSMTRHEIAAHLRKEITVNLSRIETKASSVVKKLRRLKVRTYSYMQTTPNKTELTIYVLNSRTGATLITTWYKSGLGLVHAAYAFEEDEVVFYNEHFYERYSERHLLEKRPTKDAAKHYHLNRGFETCRKAWVRENVFEVSIYSRNGVALGIRDASQRFTVVNTFISTGALTGQRQRLFNAVEPYRRVMELIREIEPEYYRQVEQFQDYLVQCIDPKDPHFSWVRQIPDIQSNKDLGLRPLSGQQDEAIS
jgi:hypothetical protein